MHLIACLFAHASFFAFQVVSGGKRVSVTGNKTQSTVVISKACPEDKGSYTIVVRNQRGSAHHTVSLSVIGETAAHIQT